jgi:hypothetical protein
MNEVMTEVKLINEIKRFGEDKNKNIPHPGIEPGPPG